MHRHLACTLGLVLLSPGVPAQTRVAPLADPWLPPASRAANAAAPPSRGAALEAQVLAKLAQQFQQADVSGRGALSLDEARRAGWGFAVQNFDRLDRSGRGEIRMQDLQHLVKTQMQEPRERSR